MVSAVRKKHLGQHFLTNPDTARRIAGFLDGDQGPVIEIGPGAGILTEALLSRFDSIHLIEKDASLVDPLKDRFGDRVIVHQGDVLEIFPELIQTLERAAIVSNLPYNISSPVTFMLCHTMSVIPEMVLMYQKEVADRIRKEPGPLHLAVTTWYEVEEMMRLKPGSFSPPPKVDSAVLHFRRRDEFPVEPAPSFFRFCRMIYENRRKLLVRNLKRFGPDAAGIPEKLGFPANVRVDQLANRQLIEIYKEFCTYELHI